MTDPRYYDPELEGAESPESRFNLSYLAGVLRSYRNAILLTLAAVAVGYTIVAVLMYLRMPSERLTTQTFRLDFEGAGSGTYPNGGKFSPNEIISTPVLLNVFQRDEVGRYMSFEQFAASIFILQANPEYERLAAEYQARLADRSLTPVDRDRITAEFESKRQSLQKNEYSINFLHRKRPDVPEALVKKVLNDILSTWAQRAVVEQRVTDYRMSVLSPDVMNEPQLSSANSVIALQVLRSRINRILENIDELGRAPGSELARTRADRMSLEEIRLRLEEIVRFQLEPLLHRVRRANVSGDHQETIQFLEAQLLYDQRKLKSIREQAAAIQSALAAYTEVSSGAPAVTAAPVGSRSGTASTDAVVPQVSESFIDRIVAMSNRSGDATYRQSLVDEYRKIVEAAIPVEQAVAYDEQLLNDFRSSGGTGTADPAAVRADITRVINDVRDLLRKVNDLHSVLSRNLVPSTQLYTETAVPITRISHAGRIDRLVAGGVVLLLLTLPLAIIASVIHDRIRRDQVSTEQPATA